MEHQVKELRDIKFYNNMEQRVQSIASKMLVSTEQAFFVGRTKKLTISNLSSGIELRVYGNGAVSQFSTFREAYEYYIGI